MYLRMAESYKALRREHDARHRSTTASVIPKRRTADSRVRACSSAGIDLQLKDRRAGSGRHRIVKHKRSG